MKHRGLGAGIVMAAAMAQLMGAQSMPQTERPEKTESQSHINLREDRAARRKRERAARKANRRKK